MSGFPGKDDEVSRRRLARLEWLAFMALCAEMLALAFWRVLAWGAAFAGIFILGLPGLFGAAVNVLFLIVFIAGFVLFLRQDLRNLSLPDRHALRRRIEDNAELAHRPLSALDDRLVNAQDERTQRLWAARLNTITGKKLRAPAPRPLLSMRDPYALRYLAALVFVAGLIVSGPLWSQRLMDGLLPLRGSLPAFQIAAPMSVQIIPPAYTGLAGMTAAQFGENAPPLTIPAGSIIKIRTGSRFGAPYVEMGGKRILMEEIGARSYGLETEITHGEAIIIRQNILVRATLPYIYKADTPPFLTEDGEVEVMPEGSMRFPLKITDDYGAEELILSMDLDPAITERPLGEAFTEKRLVITPAGEEAALRPVFDLSWHTWAGLPVILTLQANDGSGQISEELRYDLILPERKFTHPVSQLLAAMRQQLAWTPKESAIDVADGLIEVMSQIGTYDGDIVTFLAMRTAASRLYYAPGIETARAVIPLLWETAMALDDGGLRQAMRQLRQAQADLESALSNPDSSQEDIAAAMTEMQNALAQYFQKLAEEMQRRMAQSGAPMPMMSPNSAAQIIDRDSLAAFLDRLRAAAMSGDTQAAREMLSRMQRLMDMMDPSMMGQMPPDMQFMQKGTNELQALIEKQQDLLDQTREKADEFGKNSESDKKTGEEHIAQESLRLMLGQLMREAAEMLDNIPDGMGKAEMAMRSSSAALSVRDPAGAIAPQEEAIEHLQDAMQQISEQLSSRMQQMIGMSFGMSPLDPLGRPMREGENGNDFLGGTINIPDEQQRERVEEILRTLRRRSGELYRPEEELDYFRRLLRQF
jgi:uncharacterized protein (TIGR02302 family)